MRWPVPMVSVSPALTSASAASLMLVAPGVVEAASVVWVAALPTEVTVAISVSPPRSMLIFSPTAKPAALCTGRFVVPAGKSSQGPVETLMNTFVGAVAAVPDTFHAAALAADDDLRTGRKVRGAAQIDGGGAGRRRRRQAGIGKAQQVMRTRRDLRAGGNGRQRHRRRPCAGIDQPPARDVHRSGASVVKLDELVGGIAARRRSALH